MENQGSQLDRITGITTILLAERASRRASGNEASFCQVGVFGGVWARWVALACSAGRVGSSVEGGSGK